MRSFARPLIVTALSSAALLLACGSGNHLGGLVVAINTNVSVPKDIDGLGLAVSVDGITKFSNVYGVSPNGQVTLPATLVLEEPSTQGQAVNIRVMAFSGGNIRIVRDSITTIPHGRVAVLRLQLSALSFNDGAKGSIDLNEVDRTTNPGAQSAGALHLTDSTSGFDPFLKITSKCDLTKELADIDGICQDAKVDSSTLPDAVNTPIAPSPAELAACFDVGRCFAAPTTVTPDGSCTFAYTGDPAMLNVALVMDAAGFPTSAGSLAPLDLDPEHGFSIKSGIVSLPKGACAQNPHRRSVVTSTACASKTVETPIINGGGTCPASSFDAGTPPNDSGATIVDAAADADAGPPVPALVVSTAQLGMTKVVALAPYPNKSAIYVADVVANLEVVDIGQAPAVVASAKGTFVGNAGTTLTTNGANGADVLVVTFPAAQTAQYLNVDVTQKPPVFSAAAKITAGGEVYGGAFYLGDLYLASQHNFYLDVVKSPVVAGSTSQLISAASGWFDAVTTDPQGSLLYGTLYDATTPTTKPGLLTIGGGIVTASAMTATPSAGHTGSLVYVSAPKGFSGSSLVLTNADNGDVDASDLSSGSITRLAAGMDIVTGTNQPFNLATDSNGNVYFATKTSGIIKLPVYPKPGVATPIVAPANAKGARSVMVIGSELYFTTDDGSPSTSGVWKIAIP